MGSRTSVSMSHPSEGWTLPVDPVQQNCCLAPGECVVYHPVKKIDRIHIKV